MPPLEKNYRSQLERTVKEARDVAEAAARASIEQLGVGESAAFSHLTDPQRELRRKLRVHGRQLGDVLNTKTNVQEIDRLIEEAAYEHWHRMLFARFLAENNLLMYPDPDDPVAVTLEECEEVAGDEGAATGWELAARFAARMLPRIFRTDSPVFQLILPPEHQKKLESLVAGLSLETFTASDSMGWVYQFWQAKKKEEVNASGEKIGARELPSVTQLFTEPYMVSFLLDNSLGAWWAARRLSKDDLKNAKNEEELREKASIQGVPLEYLRFVQQEDGEWISAAGNFDDWPEHLSELKTLDPCCGSGHFLVAAFLMLVPMRMELEGLSAREAVDAVLRENLHGLEIDRRCVELAAFALAYTAWKYPESGGYRVLPELNLACSGLSVGSSRKEWEKLANGDSKLRVALIGLYEEFKNASALGSLIDPRRSQVAKLVDWSELANAMQKALGRGRRDEEREAGIVAHGLVKTASLLSNNYQWIITNVPYLARGKHSDILMSFINKHYYDERKDLAAVMTERILKLLDNGTFCVVVPQNLFQLTGYTKFRKKLLTNKTLYILVRLGARAFETISGENVSVSLVIIDSQKPRNNHKINAFELSKKNNPAEKSAKIQTIEALRLSQVQQVNNADSRVILIEGEPKAKLLSTYSGGIHGLGTKDAPMFIKYFWEIEKKGEEWEFLQASINNTGDWSGMESVIYWQCGKGELHDRAKVGKAILAGGMAYGKSGVLVSPVGEMRCCIYHGSLFDKSTAVISPTDKNMTASIYCYAQSDKFKNEIKLLDSKVAVTNKTLVKVPFDLDHWTKIAAEKYPNGLPEPYSDAPTQWIFHGHPCGSVIWGEENKRLEVVSTLRNGETVLHVAVARLLGYRWPAELDDDMKLADEQRGWVRQCDTLLPYADDDGIVCIPPVRGEASAADRLLNLIATAYGDDWTSDTLGQLLKNADHAGKTLENWLREKFFAQHCKLFRHRPFIWHIWDGLRDGFAALVNYHKLDAKLLETLIYTYLGDWISRQKQDIASGIDGAEERLAAAEGLKKRLELILEGEEPYDIFVRWKPIEKQPIGWNPDLNDGVRLNIRPFMTVPDVGKKGAGVLRDKPNIKWGKDRGKDVASAPWFHLFKGDRINDHHLTLKEKLNARKGMGGPSC